MKLMAKIFLVYNLSRLFAKINLCFQVPVLTEEQEQELIDSAEQEQDQELD
jgi:hypothetical protein